MHTLSSPLSIAALPLAALVGAVALAPPASAQNLRFAVAAADVVVVGTDVSVRPLGKNVIVHRIRVDRTLSGTAPAELSVVEFPRLSLHQRPKPAQRRVYCLHAIPARTADRLPIPGSLRPLYKMSGETGSNPKLVGGLPSEPAQTAAADRAAKARPGNPAAKLLEFIDIVTSAEKGTASAKLAPRLVRLALDGDPACGAIRLEAARLLAERQALHATLTAVDLSRLTSRAVAETDDVPLKIALAELCTVCKVEGLVDSLVLGIEQVPDSRWPSTVGRLAEALHGPEAANVLRRHIAAAGKAKARGPLLIALGATSTEGALDALLNWRQRNGPGQFVDAALRAHGSPKALAELAATPAADTDAKGNTRTGDRESDRKR